MPAALALAVLAAQCVPARWFSPEPKSLALLASGPVNCLLVDHPSALFIAEAHRRGLKLLGSFEGADASITPVTRAAAHPGSGLIVLSEGVWPGLRSADDVIATPSSAPWVDTNLGYLRYLRAQAPNDAIWLANRPPPGQSFPIRRYQQILGDAALAGAVWVIDIDDKFTARLLSGDASAKKDWADLLRSAAFLHSLPDHREPYSRLGVSVAPNTGALVSGGVLDMIAAQHIPFQVTKTAQGLDQFFDFADNSIVKFPPTSLNRTQVLPDDVGKLEPVYRRVEVIVGRTNFGLRVFNGAAVLTAPFTLGKGVGILLDNFTDFPAENITLHVQGTWKKAFLDEPGQPPKPLNIYPVQTATAVEIDSLNLLALVRIE